MAAVLFIVIVPVDKTATTNKDTVEKSGENDNLRDFLENKPLTEVLKQILKDVGIENAAWMLTENEKSYQVTFTCQGSELCETTLNILTEVGIGKQSATSISVIPTSIYFPLDNQQETYSQDQDDDQSESTTGRSKFVKSIKSRLTVAQVVETVRNAGNLTFDYVLLIILASIIAAIGLSENSSVILVASMLISPLMGPILAGTFGAVIAHKLRNQGVKTELIGLIICIIIGFVYGLLLGSWGDQLGWPTKEMASRGELRSLLVGMFIALPSGAAVAISILGGNIGSLVGVAISASLLPPAVNAGILWAYSIYKIPDIGFVESVQHSNNSLTYDLVNSTFLSNVTQDLSTMLYVNPALDHFKAGSVSLLLTLVNIFCIFIMGILVLKLKEVAPHTSSAMTTEFWKTDIKVARSYYQTIQNQHQGHQLGKMFLEEWDKLNTEKGSGTKCVKGEEAAILGRRFQTMMEKIEDDTSYQNVLKVLPSSQQVSRQLPDQWLSPKQSIMVSPVVLHSSNNPFIFPASCQKGRYARQHSTFVCDDNPEASTPLKSAESLF
ncbi:uncharacterized protein LOC144360731 [Saccoglossus kowalevskii]